MADSKVSALAAAGAFADADILYIIQGGVSVRTTWGAVKAAILLAKYPEVANFAALPAAAAHATETYVCLGGQGVYFINRKPAGFYYCDGATWAYVGDLPSSYFTDSILQIADDADPTKLLKMQLSSLTTGTTRTVIWPDKDGTVAMTIDIGTAGALAIDTDGTLAANSDVKIASQKATKTYADTKTTAAAALSAAAGIKLDAFAAPDDVTTLNASTSAHGLSPKATAPAAGLLSVLGIGNGETVRADKPLFDTTNPAALGAVAPGSALVAARRDHIHANPAIDTLAAATDITTLNTSTSAHGLAPKAVAPAAGLQNVLGIANGETALTNKPLFDTTNPASLGAVGPGTSLLAARRDHIHANPALDTLAAPTDITTLNASTSAHGLLPKLSNVSTEFLNGVGNFATPAGGSTDARTILRAKLAFLSTN